MQKSKKVIGSQHELDMFYHRCKNDVGSLEIIVSNEEEDVGYFDKFKDALVSMASSKWTMKEIREFEEQYRRYEKCWRYYDINGRSVESVRGFSNTRTGKKIMNEVDRAKDIDNAVIKSNKISGLLDIAEEVARSTKKRKILFEY